jgi:drug/metabolite transporter superfamily protein YnfA
MKIDAKSAASAVGAFLAMELVEAVAGRTVATAIGLTVIAAVLWLLHVGKKDKNQ